MQEIYILIIIAFSAIVTAVLFRWSVGHFITVNDDSENAQNKNEDVKAGSDYREEADLMWPFLLMWFLLFAVIVALKNIWGLVAFIFVIKFLYLKNDRKKNLAFFFFFLPALPENFAVLMNPPIIDISLQLLLGLIVLLPLMVALRQQEKEKEEKIYHFDVLFGVFAFFMFMQGFRETSVYQVTLFSGFRDGIELLFRIIIPYFVISRGIQTLEDFKYAMKGFALGGIFIAVLTLIEAVIRWKIYNEISGYLNVFAADSLFSFYEIRGGLLRTSVSLVHPIFLGFYMCFVFGVIWYLKKIRGSYSSNMGAWIALLLTAIGVYTTVSRGAWLGFAMLLVIILIYRFNKGLRRVFMWAIIIPALVVSVVGFDTTPPPPSEGEYAEIDQFGTFAYRLQLAETSLQVIPKNWLFGSRTYRADPDMQELVQGQGIVDMVNGYIHIALEYGVIMLAIYLIMLFRIINAGRKWIHFGIDYNEREYKELGVILIALTVSLALQFAFTSFGGFVMMYLFFLMAIGRAAGFVQQHEEALRDKEKNTEKTLSARTEY